jgi:hypothetical protein
MSKNSRGLDDYMSIVEQSNVKTASAKTSRFSLDSITKLAEALAAEEAPAAAVAVAQANAVPAAATVVEAAPAVVAATAAVADAQVAIAGGDLAVAAAGEMPAEAKQNVGVVISAADGNVTDANHIGKDPVAVATAAGDESQEKMAELKRAEEIGAVMARAYVQEIEKIASDRQYEDAKDFLTERGLLEGYKVK